MFEFILPIPGLLHWFDYQWQHQLLPNVQAHVPASASDDGDQSCSASWSRGFSTPVLRALPKRFPAHVSDSQNIQWHSARATMLNYTEPSVSWFLSKSQALLEYALEFELLSLDIFIVLYVFIIGYSKGHIFQKNSSIPSRSFSYKF